MKLERSKMQPLVKQVTSATLTILPISVVVAGAVIQIASALFNTNYWVSLLFIWLSTACFAGAFIMGLWYESAVNTGASQYLDKIPKRELRLFSATILLFGFGLLLFLLAPAGILWSDKPYVQIFPGTKEVFLKPGESVVIGIIVESDKPQRTQVQLVQSLSSLSIDSSHNELFLGQSGISAFTVTITCSKTSPLGTYPVVIAVFPNGKSVSTGTTETILVKVANNP